MASEPGAPSTDGDASPPPDVIDEPFTDSSDPRVTGEQVRAIASGPSTVTLVGVVHDHPASVARARAVVERVDPAVLALELPPVAVGLYECYARDGRSPPAFGGEMSAAIEAATTDTVVGIDGPSRRFVAELARTLRRERPSLPTLRRVVTGLLSTSREATACRFAAGLANTLSIRLEVGDPTVHGVDRTDPPSEQAADERRQRRRARTVTSTLSPPPEVVLQDTAREAHMAARLRDRRSRGDVVAVLGDAHVEPVARRLSDQRDPADGQEPATER